MMDNIQSSWYNYQTKAYDERPVGFSLTATDDEIKPYLPQDASVWGMYTCLRQMGRSVPEAMIYVLEAVAGVEHTNPL